MKTSVGIGISPVYIPENNSEEPIVWLLRDEFTTDRAAGAVDGTAAEPGPGTRKVQADTGSAITISSGKLTITAPPGGWDNAVVGFADAITRDSNTGMFGQFTITSASANFCFGFWTTSALGGTGNYLGFASVGRIVNIDEGIRGTGTNPVGVYTQNTDYYFYINPKTSGGATFWLKGDAWADWTNVGSVGVDVTATIYFGINVYNGSMTFDFLRYPSVVNMALDKYIG